MNFDITTIVCTIIVCSLLKYIVDEILEQRRREEDAKWKMASGEFDSKGDE